jgi:hypothetical protein
MEAYIGIKSCGCVTCACTDRPEDRKQTAKTIAKWIEQGYTIERMDVEEARKRLKQCKHNSLTTHTKG